MSEHISGLLQAWLSRSSRKPQPQTRAEKILALERIKDPEIRARALSWHFKRQKIVDVGALFLLVAVASACIWVVLGSYPVEAKLVFTSLLAAIGGALIQHVFKS